MSRSKHTDPQTIRAARRIRAPFEPRNAGALVVRRRWAGILKQLGATAELDKSITQDWRSRPWIFVRRPHPGFYHPIGKREVLHLVEAVGPVALYGLRSIELVRASSEAGVPSMIFGRYEVRGRILLYEQPVPPWRLQGLVDDRSAQRFERAGAVVKLLPEMGATFVDWPGSTLQRFMREEVLLHELGHHVLQQYKAKRLVRVARTRDHEAFAARFAERRRLALRE